MAINITAKGDPEKKLKWAFKMYDVDGNGEIDKNEMLQIIQSIYDLIGINSKQAESQNGSLINSVNGAEKKTPNGNGHKASNLKDLPAENPVVRTEQIFQKMDLDKNGVISEQEFINGCLQDKFLYQMLTADYSDSF